MTKTLNALILCGGESKRMGTPKALLKYHKDEQYLHVLQLLQPFCKEVYISCKAMQASWFRPDITQLHDDPAYLDLGPISALLTAVKKNKESPYLLMGCDYPLLSNTDIKLLVDTYFSENKSCCFYNPITNIEEPLLAIYHPDDFEDLIKFYESQRHSLRFFLQQKSAIKIVPENLSRLKSFDTPEDFEKGSNLSD